MRGSSAVISDYGEYRYRLDRWWQDGDLRLVWVMLNPSTADAEVDDPTIRRCMNFSKTWGYYGVTVINLFALRATDPRELEAHPSPAGPEWTEHCVEVLSGIQPIVAAWGARPIAEKPGAELVKALGQDAARLFCLGTTKNGHPRHPLYVKSDQRLIPYPLAEPGEEG